MSAERLAANTGADPLLPHLDSAACRRTSKDVRESLLRDSESYVLMISKHAHRSLHKGPCPVPGRLTFVALRQVQPTNGHKLVDAAKRYFARQETCHFILFFEDTIPIDEGWYECLLIA